MTLFEKYSLFIGAIGVGTTIMIIIVAIWGERIRQIWASPKMKIVLDSPTFNVTTTGIKGWYYLIRISNERRSNPAKNVRLLLMKIFKKGPDGIWREQKFSGPTQVMWQWPQISPLYATIGPDERATFGCLLEDSNSIELRLYWYPNNLSKTIPSNEPTRIEFIAESDTTQSNILTIEIAWDGKWVEGSAEMQNHFVVKEVAS